MTESTERITHQPKLYATDIPKILESPEVRNLTKDTIRAAMTKDPFDAVTDLQLALAAVEAWADDILNNNGAGAQSNTRT